MTSSNETFPFLPIKDTVLFPSLEIPLLVGRPSSIAAVEAALASEEKTIIVITQKNADVEEPTQTDLYTVGTKALIRKMIRTPDHLDLILQGVESVRLVSLEPTPTFKKAHVTPIPPPRDEGTEMEALHRAVLDQTKKIDELLESQWPGFLPQMLHQFRNPLIHVYLLASLLNVGLEKKQEILESPTRMKALQLIHDFLTHEIQVLELRKKIATQAATEMTREQRDYLLRQQMQAIQKELGEKSPEQADLEIFREKIKKAELPEEVRKEAERELARLERLPTAAPDYQLTRVYLELLAELPWKKSTVDNLDLGRARKILDEDHYDLDEVKGRILEHLAVRKLNPEAKGPILCFVGGPGVGKTSVGTSIARALERKFDRMSLGGLHDEAELRGHRRTYIGAFPGRIIQAIRRSGVNNPLIMLDEIDKIGHDFRGDPAAALMEILDPAQNFSFRDNYLDLPFDLSKVFFITTANTLDTIPKPLLDRMEVLHLSGYCEEEKLEIARHYLFPRQLSEAGLNQDKLLIPDETMSKIIRLYTREAGVRELERQIGRIARKVAIQFAEGKTNQAVVNPPDLVDLLGPERFFAEKARKELPPGVAIGLAWTSTGGDVLYIETVLMPGAKGLTLTGQLGEVMKESAQAAESYIWSQRDLLGIPLELFQKSGVHIHVPAGAIPKDGPSAGITVATALTSLYTKKPTLADTAMTGEVTLAGLVLPVGGIKEKVLAARRAGIKRIILSKENLKDLKDIPETIRKEITFIPVERLEEVFQHAIPGLKKS